MLTWQIGEAADQHALRLVSEGVLQFGRAQAVGGQALPLVCLVRDQQEVVAGGTGRTEFGRLFINHLWVTEAWRGQGLGTQVLARMESAALDRACVDALIETLSDRTAALYERCGYTPLAVIPRYVGPFNRHTLLKPLSGRPC